VIELIVANLPEGYSVDVVHRDETGQILAATELMPPSEFGTNKDAARNWARAYARDHGYLFEPSSQTPEAP